MLRSKPTSRTGYAGTASSSADRKSASTMPYFSFRICRMFNFTASLSVSFRNGREPTSRFSSSPRISWGAVRFIWASARCGSRSVTQKTGSCGSSPMFTVTLLPSALTTTPCRESGMVGHWYFLMPP